MKYIVALLAACAFIACDSHDCWPDGPPIYVNGELCTRVYINEYHTICKETGKEVPPEFRLEKPANLTRITAP